MNLSRTEVDLETGHRIVVDQCAYSNSAGEVIVLDSGVSAPAGYSEIFELPGEAPSSAFNRLLSILNAEYQKDVDSFSKAFTLAVMFDGSSEEAKKANIRTQYAARKTKYATDLSTLRTQYGA
jgi:hypothetical protein